MAGTVLLLLNGLGYCTIQFLGDGIDSRGNLITLVAHDDHEVLRVQAGGCVEGVAEK